MSKIRCPECNEITHTENWTRSDEMHVEHPLSEQSIDEGFYMYHCPICNKRVNFLGKRQLLKEKFPDLRKFILSGGTDSSPSS